MVFHYTYIATSLLNTMKFQVAGDENDSVASFP